MAPLRTHTTHSCSERNRGNVGEVFVSKKVFMNNDFRAWGKLQTFRHPRLFVRFVQAMTSFLPFAQSSLLIFAYF